LPLPDISFQYVLIVSFAPNSILVKLAPESKKVIYKYKGLVGKGLYIEVYTKTSSI